MHKSTLNYFFTEFSVLSLKYYIFNFSRFSNIVKSSLANVEDIWRIVKKIKPTSLMMECKSTKRLYHWNQKSLITDIQKLLQVEESMITKEKLTVEDLESSAKMFIYLITCSDDLRSLFAFYKNMFLKSPDLILLTLNRIMKLEGDTSPNKELKLLSSKIYVILG